MGLMRLGGVRSAGIRHAANISEPRVSLALHIAAAFLASLLSLAPTKFGVSVAPSKRPPSVGSLAFDLVVEDGTLQAAPGVAECMLGVSSPEAWPERASALPTVCSMLQRHNPMLLHELLVGVALAIEASVLASSFKDTNALILLADSSASRGADSSLMLVADSLGRNAYATSRLARKFAKKFCLHRSKLDHAAQLRYLMASRRELLSCTSFATSVDATRFAKRDWSCGLMCNADSGRCMWMPPVVDCCGQSHNFRPIAPPSV